MVKTEKTKRVKRKQSPSAGATNNSILQYFGKKDVQSKLFSSVGSKKTVSGQKQSTPKYENAKKTGEKSTFTTKDKSSHCTIDLCTPNAARTSVIPDTPDSTASCHPYSGGCHGNSPGVEKDEVFVSPDKSQEASKEMDYTIVSEGDDSLLSEGDSDVIPGTPRCKVNASGHSVLGKFGSQFGTRSDVMKVNSNNKVRERDVETAAFQKDRISSRVIIKPKTVLKLSLTKRKVKSPSSLDSVQNSTTNKCTDVDMSKWNSLKIKKKKSPSLKGIIQLPDQDQENDVNDTGTDELAEAVADLKDLGYIGDLRIKKTRTPLSHGKLRYSSWSGAVLGKRSPIKGNSPCKKKPNKHCADKVPVRSLLKELNISVEEIDIEETSSAGVSSTPIKTPNHNTKIGHHDIDIDCMSDGDSLCNKESHDPPKYSFGDESHDQSFHSALWESLDESMLAAMDMESDHGKDKNLDKPQMENYHERDKNKIKHDDWKGEEKPLFLQNRYKVVNVEHYPGSLIVKVVSRYDEQSVEKTLVLQGVWCNTLLDVGTKIGLHGQFDSSNTCILNQQENFLLVEPDILLTGTNIASSIRCVRRSVLSEFFKGSDFSSKAMACGTLLHEVFQEAILKRNFSKQNLSNIIMTTIAKQPHLNNMYTLGLQEADMLDVVEPYIQPLMQWANIYLQSTPSNKSAVDIKFPGDQHSTKYNVCVSDVRDIEDNMWCPHWGIKGKMDITAEVKIHKQTTYPKNTTTRIVPLELKTGRPTNSVEHRGQLILYTLMLTDVMSSNIDMGLLLYLKNGDMLSVPANHMDKRELLYLRNQLAYYLSQKTEKDESSKLPDLIDDDFTCSRCQHLQKCALLYKTVDKEEKSVSERILQILHEEIDHLTTIHYEYFTKWYKLCQLEMKAMKRTVLWKKPAIVREQSGNCLSQMLVQGSVEKSIDGHYVTVFSRCAQLSSTLPPIDSVGIMTGDRLVVSLQDLKRIALCIGFVLGINNKTITMAIEKDLDVYYDRQTTVYRLDKDDGFSVVCTSLNNLSQMLCKKTHCVHLSELVVDLKKPESDDKSEFMCKVPNEQLEYVKQIMSSVNCIQQKAIERVLLCRDYSLIVGMPGTGKTTTIVALVRILVACKLSVLLTSYTHSAVDNILFKLHQHDIDFLRVGPVHKIHSSIHKYSDSKLSKKCQSVADLSQLYQSKSVVATTCLGVKHVLFSQRRFDVCIVDEASQINQLVCIGPLLCAERFVLVGDHRQLPPLVRSIEARELGMDESLFQRLSIHENCKTELCLQYRMNEEIMSISNKLVYDGKLQCGNDTIADGKLVLPDKAVFVQMLENRGWSHSWLAEIIATQGPVNFLNTDKIPAPHEKRHTSLINKIESQLVSLLIKALLKCGCDASGIGVIAPYTEQCKLITNQLTTLPSHQQLEVSTVDKYQGRDKNVIIVSFVRCAEEDKAGSEQTQGILQDIRRLNVAITRAKHKFIMLGSVETLSRYGPLKSLLDFLRGKKQILDLPVGANTMYEECF